jgi:AcrR family transcriptional regulator
LATAPLSLRQRKKDATHQAIADAAWELFAEQGYEQTSINDIADRANVAPRTFFRYFPTKEAVVYPELDRTLNSVRDEFFRRPSGEPLMTSLIEALSTMAESMTDDSDRNRQRLALLKRSPADSISEHVRRRITDQVEDWVRIRDHDHPDVELLAKLASGLIGLIMDTSREHWIATGAVEALPDVGQRCMSLVVELLVPKPS